MVRWKLSEVVSLDSAVEQFEEKMKNSVSFRFRHERDEHKELLLRHHTANSFNLMDFLSQYRDPGIYPQARIDKLAYQLIDIKLQMYLIELDLGADNNLMGILMPEKDSAAKEDHIQFVHLTFDQSLILKSRILWERVMNFVYYLETGKSLVVGGNKSKKAKFFEYISGTKWSFLEDFKEYIEWFDNAWRTPETHKGSKLRARLLAGTMDNDEVNRILGLVSIVTNSFYVNLMLILKDQPPAYRFWTYGMSEEKKALPES